MPSRRTSIAQDSQSNYNLPHHYNSRRVSLRRTSLAHSLRTEWSHNQQMIGRTLVRYENTYRLEPCRKPQFATVEQSLKKFLDDRLAILSTSTANTTTSARAVDNTCDINSMFVARRLADEVRQYVKSFDYPRYKIICFVAIGQDIGQGIQIFLLNLEKVQ
ncbi:hypothetical protein HELRODRAFT_163766 [Helobdella robusta]|uniref:Uncharacterized protein n=1 Tax=Helobdella robusta TaxID=6412 RepID=T1EUG0_HELRO|nr:hypothetical protein HELRODRAFT_163766 [Helobdella robusta]ESN96671.1 hypothetical protein HELRODRAFT_163766 [Helobdella robusta]